MHRHGASRRNACIWLFALIGFGALAASKVAWADGVLLNGITPRSLGRGGTDMGFADNGGIIYDNPAAMVNVDGCGLLDVGVDMLIVSGRYRDPGIPQLTAPNDARSSTFTPLPQIGLIHKSEDGCWAYGLGIFTPGGFSEHFSMTGPDGGQHEYESFGAQVRILPALACRVTDRLSIGGTLGVGVSYGELEGPYFLQGPTLPGPLTLLHTHGAGADLVWSAGLQYELTECTTFGAAYVSPAPFTLRGTTTVDVLAPPIGFSGYDTEIDITWPQSVAIGIRHALCPHRTIAADVIWYDWSHSFDRFALTLHDPTNPGFPPQIVEHFPLNWSDSVSVRLGYEQKLDNGMTVRCGYAFSDNPIPNSTLTPFIQAFLEHMVSVGATWTWCDWDVDLSYAHLFAPTQHVGNSAFIGGDFSNSTHDVSVDAIMLSFMRHY